MMYILIGCVAFFASLTSFFSGFGLSTVLVPALAIFFPIPTAILIGAIVHFSNSLFKLFLVGKLANKKIIVFFGLPAVCSAIVGAWVLNYINHLPVLLSYELLGISHEITPIKLLVGLIILVFSILEFFKKFESIHIPPKFLPVGGILSGFFGGLSGNQGALRSMFLLRTKLDKNEFIASNVVISTMVDTTRILFYVLWFFDSNTATMNQEIIYLLIFAISMTIFGSRIAKSLLPKLTINFIKLFVAILLSLIGLLMIAGII